MSIQKTQNDNQQQVEDPGEFNQRARLQEIAEARREARRDLRVPDPDLSPTEQALQAFRSVQALAAELEWLVRHNGGDEYFTDELGPITIQPPTEDELKQEREVCRIWGAPNFEPEEISIKGLYSSEPTGPGFIDFPEQVSSSWTAHVDLRNQGPDDVTLTRGTHIPVEVSMRANRLCRRFIHDAGLDARIEKEIDEDPNPV